MKTRNVRAAINRGGLGCLLVLFMASAGCGGKTANSGRIEVTIEIDPALMLDSVHVDATAEGKPTLPKDFPASGLTSLKWTILIANPKPNLTATLVARGLRGADTLVTYTAYAQISAGRTVQVLLRLNSQCAGIAPCARPDETCDKGVCVKRPTFGMPDGGVDSGGGGDGAGGVDGQSVGDVAQREDASDDGPGSDAGMTIMCPASEHLCGDRCVSNSDVRTCGTSCSPCDPVSDGTATCDGTRCGADCPTGKKLCKGACIDSAAACDGMCPPGSHACASACPSNESVNACGTSCDPCPVPTGASQATCDGVKCDFQCATGFHKCGTTCARDDATGACGMTCQVCPTDTNGAAQCVGGTCSLRCNAGFHVCANKCVSDTSPETCGTSCNSCVAPTGGTATCEGGRCGATCPAGRKACLGACVDMAAACSGVCPAGTHNCNGTCASDSSVNSCGATSCATCPMPAGAAQATCDGTRCDFTCGAGFHRCGATCAADSSASACGSACTACPADPNGSAACLSGTCGLMCRAGYHLCGTQCASNMAVASCGLTSCTPCQAPMGGTVTCDGLACVPACPSGTKLCSGACIPNANACNGVCPGGSHNCGGVCSSNTSVASCGSSCTSCPVPTNGVATCNGTSCGITCNTGYHNCSGSCVLNTSTNSCGTSSCAACTPPANAVATCNGTACGFTCAPGFHNCSGACVSNSNTATCGMSCSACPAPANSTPTCNGTTCDFTCNTSFHPCGSACYPTTDGTHCGASCMDCSQPNATAGCNASTGTCSNSCVGLTFSCAGAGGMPVCGTWGFESGTTEGWRNTSNGYVIDASGGQFSGSNARAWSGLRSLSIGHNNPSPPAFAYSVVQGDLCPSAQAQDLSQRTFSFKIFLAPSSPTPNTPLNRQFNVEIVAELRNGTEGVGIRDLDAPDYPSLPVGQWVTMTAPLFTAPTVTAVAILVRTYNSPWVGMIYFDDIRVQ